MFETFSTHTHSPHSFSFFLYSFLRSQIEMLNQELINPKKMRT